MDGDFRGLRWERREGEGMVEAVGLWDGEGVKVRLMVREDSSGPHCRVQEGGCCVLRGCWWTTSSVGMPLR
jgi:hypothetical protein